MLYLKHVYKKQTKSPPSTLKMTKGDVIQKGKRPKKVNRYETDDADKYNAPIIEEYISNSERDNLISLIERNKTLIYASVHTIEINLAKRTRVERPSSTVVVCFVHPHGGQNVLNHLKVLNKCTIIEMKCLILHGLEGKHPQVLLTLYYHDF